MERISDSQQAHTVAVILAIGTANPTNCVYQSDYPDWYFRVTNNEHQTDLKDKFRRICDKSMIKKRYIHVTEDFLKENPSITTYKAPSLDARQEVLVTEVPKLGKEAALKAIGEWGRPVSELTHLIFCTSSGIDMPGADLELTKLLGLSPSAQRFMIYQNGCYAAGPALRLAKDVAENNRTARVLVVCSEITLCCFHEPCGSHPDVLVGSALFADGAAAVIVGADPVPGTERPLFQLVWAKQALVPGSEDGIVGKTREMGLAYYLSRKVSNFIADNIVERLMEPIGGVMEWRSLFYVVHPGGPAVLKGIEERLGLTGGEMEASRHVLREYGNMWSPSVLFIMDHMRRKSAEEGKATTGEGKEWRVLFAFGPGLTVETILLRSVPTQFN